MEATVLGPVSAYPIKRRPLSQRKRRRRLVRLVTVGIVAALLVFLVPRIVHTITETDVPEMVSYTVNTRDTLWDVAARHSGRRDVRQVVYAIKEANHLGSGVIHPGQVLEIPVGNTR